MTHHRPPHHPGPLPADHLGTALSHALLPFHGGLVFGGLILICLSSRRLRWTWALVIAPFAFLSWPVSWRAGLVLSAGLVVAVAGGVRLEMEARRKGGEEARAAREAIGPLAGLRILIAERRGRRAQPRDDAFPLGRTPDGRVAWVPRGRIGHGVHALLVGVTGGGKTVTMMRIIQAHVLAGTGAVVVDPKGDRRLRAMLRALAAALGVPFREWSPSGPAVYNPIGRGSATEIADKALSGHTWTEPHYEAAVRRLLGLSLATMQTVGKWPPTLSGLVEAMDPDRLDALADRAGGEVADRVHAYVDGLGAQGRADQRGGRDRLAILCESGLGRWLDPALGGEGEQVDLAACLAAGEIVYVCLDADRYPAASRLLASALVIDLAGLVGERQGAGRAGVLALDEFSALAAEHVARLAARARGAGISLLLGAQSLADLRAARPGDPTDTMTEQIISNVEYIVAHRVADADAAERLARVGGTEPDWTLTERVDGAGGSVARGEGTRTRGREFRVGPDRFKTLKPGEAVLIHPTARRPTRVIRVWQPEPLSSSAATLARKDGFAWA
jgi:hypothetical protein